MGNCATKPKVLKDSDDAPPPLEQQKKEFPAEEDAAALRRSQKGKEIMVEADGDDDDDDEQQGAKRPSLSHLFNEDKQMETIQMEKTEPEPIKQEMDNQIGPSSEVTISGGSVPEIYGVKAPQPLKQEFKNQTHPSKVPEVKVPQEMIENQTGPSPEVPKPEDCVLEVPEVKVLPQMQQEMIKNQTDPSAEVPTTGASVPETSEVLKIPEVSAEAKEAYGIVALQQTPEEAVFVDAQEKMEAESVVNATMATDNKETAFAEANNAKDSLFVEAGNKEKDVSLEETTTLSELGTEEKKTAAEKPQVAK